MSDQEDDGVLAFVRRWLKHWEEEVALLSRGWKKTTDLRDGRRVDTTAAELQLAKEKVREMRELIAKHEVLHAQKTQ